MTNSIPHLIKAIEESKNLYYRLIIFVGLNQTGKSFDIKELSKISEFSILNLNKTLSLKLLDISAKQRAIQTPKVLTEIIDSYTGGLILEFSRKRFSSTQIV
jgi:hypothetical protein